MSTEKPYLKAFIISDLHIGAGKTDDCDLELEQKLIEFIDYLSSKNEKVELIINGDFLDFVQSPPLRDRDLRSESIEGIPLCFTEKQSLEKLESIQEAHRPVFDALRGYLTVNGGNRLVILPGNHDADFFWPGVREKFIDIVGRSSAVCNNLFFHFEYAYYPHGQPKVRIEHGHMYDPCNWFKVGDIQRWSTNSPPIFKDYLGQNRLLECVGTRFLNKFINKLDEDYPFVDNVKPFSKFLELFGMSALRPDFGPFKAAVAIWSMIKFISGSVVHHPADFLKLDNTANLKVRHPLQLFVNEMSDSQRFLLTKILKQNGFAMFCPLSMYIENKENAEKCIEFLADYIDYLNDFHEKDPALLSLSGSSETLSLGKGFVTDETVLLENAAKSHIESENLDFIIMGHTHVPVNRPRKFNYINTGSWTRYYRFKEGECPHPWSILKEDSYNNFPYELNYAEVYFGKETSAQLITFGKRNYD